MIVMKFGGSSVADAERIQAVAGIVAQRLSRRPLVIVSALAGVTDLLVEAVGAARRGERENLERLLADLQRRHRWAVAGGVASAGRRHDLSLEVDGLFEDLRQRLRSIRILGEATSRATDAVLATGEILSSKIVAAAFRDRGLPARWIDPRDVLSTDESFGEAEPDADAVRERCRTILEPALEAGDTPLIGGFVGATAAGETTTLGRGGSDTSAVVLGSMMEAEEIQLWTDVDGLMSADPRLVPSARTLPAVSFADAAELAYYGARVLHPDCIAPAVQRRIPVRILNSLRPESPGTVIVQGGGENDLPALASVASRGGVCVVRVTSRKMRADTTFLPGVLRVLEAWGSLPDLVVATEVAASLTFPRAVDTERLARGLGEDVEIEAETGRAVVCVIGSGLAERRGFRESVLATLSGLEPETVALGASRTSVAVVVPESSLQRVVRELHRRFFEEEEPE